MDDLDRLAAYLLSEDPRAARWNLNRIGARVRGPADHPYKGRTGRVEATRELVVDGTPYVVAYSVVDQHIDVLAVMHGAQTWPDSFGSR